MNNTLTFFFKEKPKIKLQSSLQYLQISKQHSVKELNAKVPNIILTQITQRKQKLKKMNQVTIRQLSDSVKRHDQIQIICTICSQTSQQFGIDHDNPLLKVECTQTTSKQFKKRKYKQKKSQESSDYSPKQLQESSYSKFDDIQIKQTKNIPKLYGKGITLFIQKIEPKIQFLLKNEGINKKQFYKKVMHYQKKLISIPGIRQMWSSQNNKQGKIFRILSNLFLRKHSLHHIFNSRILFHHRALKFRYKFIEGVKNPSNFAIIKQF